MVAANDFERGLTWQELDSIFLVDSSAGTLKGINWDRQKKSWRARITINRREIHLGRFPTRDEAIMARRSAEQQYHGEFARSV
jgi:hypothetical protein